MAFGLERAPIDATISAWLVHQFHSLRGLLYVRELLHGYDEVTRSYWERAHTIREELANEYKAAMQVEEIWQGEVMPEINMAKSSKALQNAKLKMESRQHEYVFMVKRFEFADGDKQVREVGVSRI